MRKNWRMRVTSDLRGKITTGTKGVSKSGKEIPKSLNYFNLEKFPELQEAYGEKPDRLIIVFGIEDMNLFFQTEYVVWAQTEKGTWKKRQCDGETCRHLVPETINGIKFERGDEHECFGCGSDGCTVPADDQCKCYTGFSAYVVDPRIGRVIQFTPYRFQTNSVNSSDNILSTLHTIFQQYGKVPRSLPFELEVRMVEQQTDTGKSKFPLWYLKPWGTVQQINEIVKRTSLPTNEENSIITDVKRMLNSAPSSEPRVVSATEEAKELVAEITGTEPEDIEVIDITDRRGVLSAVQIDMNNGKQLIAFIVKMLMDIAGGDKEKGRRLLLNLTGHQSSAKLTNLSLEECTKFFDKAKEKYRKYLQKLEANEDQTSVV